MCSAQKILITGASGFIGSAMVERALQLGYETWAGIRSSSSREYLTDARIRFIDLNYADVATLSAQLQTVAGEEGRIDAVVHVAGITKTAHKDDFDRINFRHTQNLADALIQSGTMPCCFVFMSTLGAIGAGSGKDFRPIPADAAPHPDTAYGRSKLKAESYLKSLDGFPYVILRPTGVYGPRDRDYLILMRAVKRGLSVGAGFGKQLLSFIYIDDLVDTIFTAIQKGIYRKAYNVADGDVHTDATFNDIVRKVLHKKHLLRLIVPLWLVKPAAWLNEKLFALMGKATTFNSDKYHIMKQRNWACDITPLREELDFCPRYRLEEGVAKTVAWYQSQKWL